MRDSCTAAQFWNLLRLWVWFLDLLDLVTGGSAGPAIGSLHSVQACVQPVCVQIVLWIGNVRIVGSGLDPAFSSGFWPWDRSGTRSECENALTHRNEFLLLAVKEFWY